MYLQECVHAMRTIKLSHMFKRLFLLPLVHARARAFDHASVQECVFVLMLLLKLLSVVTSIQVYETSILGL
jgi:hypothetical protein